MTGGLRAALTVLLAAVIGAGGGVAAVIWLQQAPEETVQRPDFTLPDLAGERRRIAEWDGDIVVLNFWATWCAPCREEIPLFTELQTAFDDQGVQFLGVAIDDPEVGEIETVAPIPKFAGTPGEVEFRGPAHGEHNVDVYGGERGLSAEEIATLESEGVI